MLREALTLLRERTEAAEHDEVAWADVVYGLTRLAEAEMPAPHNGRADMVQDLQRRALAVETTHDPAVVQDLLHALKAFLDEELDEALTAEAPEEGGEAMDQEAAARKSAAEADNFMKYSPTAADLKPEPDADVAVNARRAAAEADGFMRYGDVDDTNDNGSEEEPMAAKETMQCEACGHEQPLPTPTALPAQESAMSVVGTEANQLIESLRTQLADAQRTKPLAETERSELVSLRTLKRKQDAHGRAVAAIKTAEAEGFIKPEELMEFQESQWSVLIPRWMGPLPEYGTGPKDMPEGNSRPSHASAAETFSELWNR